MAEAVSANAADVWPVLSVIAFVSSSAGVGAFADVVPAGSSAPHAPSASAPVSSSPAASRFIITPESGTRAP